MRYIISSSYLEAEEIVKTIYFFISLLEDALKGNFVFDHLDDFDTRILVNAMTIVKKDKGENVIVQGIFSLSKVRYIHSVTIIFYFAGEAGDFFYIIEEGTFTVVVDSKPVGSLGPGKSFGEFALIYDVPRQATIRSDTNSTLFALDRNTFKFTLANNMEDKTSGLGTAIDKVPLLNGLTPQQREKLTDSVVLVDYNPGILLESEPMVLSVYVCNYDYLTPVCVVPTHPICNPQVTSSSRKAQKETSSI